MCSQLDTFPVTVTFCAETVPVRIRWTYFTGDSIPPFCYTVIESAEKQGVRVPFFGMLDR